MDTGARAHTADRRSAPFDPKKEKGEGPASGEAMEGLGIRYLTLAQARPPGALTRHGRTPGYSRYCTRSSKFELPVPLASNHNRPRMRSRECSLPFIEYARARRRAYNVVVPLPAYRDGRSAGEANGQRPATSSLWPEARWPTSRRGRPGRTPTSAPSASNARYATSPRDQTDVTHVKKIVDTRMVACLRT